MHTTVIHRKLLFDSFVELLTIGSSNRQLCVLHNYMGRFVFRDHFTVHNERPVNSDEVVLRKLLMQVCNDTAQEAFFC